MRRFELDDGSGVVKFWQVDLQGEAFTATWGKVGSGSKNQRVKRFPSADAAAKECEKQVAEKIREGFVEVGDGAATAAPAKAAAVAAPASSGAGAQRNQNKDALTSSPAAAASTAVATSTSSTATSSAKSKGPEIPPRATVAAPTAAAIADAAAAVAAVSQVLGRRSWMITHAVARARRALARVAGVDPAKHPALRGAVDQLVSSVGAGKGRLAPRHAIDLLMHLHISAFERALKAWDGVDVPSLQLVAAQAKAIGAELALRAGQLLLARPENATGSEAGWKKRWKALAPLVEAQLAHRAAGTSLADHIFSLDAGGDLYLQRRLATARP